MRHESSVVVSRPIDDVWAFTSNLPFHLPRGRSWVLGFRWTSPGPPRLGSTFQQRVVILGVETRVHGEVTEWDPPHSATFSLRGAGIRSGFFRVTLETTADGTKLAIVMEFKPRLAFKPLWWIAGPFLKRRWDFNSADAKRVLEAGEDQKAGGNE